MKTGQSKLRGVWRVTVQGVRRCRREPSERATERNSITPGITEREVLIASLLVLSLVQQIVGVSLPLKLGDRQDDDN